MIDRIFAWLDVSKGERLRVIAQVGREAALALAAIISLAVLLLGGVPRCPSDQALFAAAMAILSIVITRWADASGTLSSTRRRNRTGSYGSLWLTSFAVVFGALILAEAFQSLAP